MTVSTLPCPSYVYSVRRFTASTIAVTRWLASRVYVVVWAIAVPWATVSVAV